MYKQKGFLFMKISPVGNQIYFNGQTDAYKDEIKEKSNTTLKLTIGTAVAGAALLAVYYITKGKKPAETNLIAGKQDAEELAQIVDKTSKEVLDKINPKILSFLDELDASPKEFSERLITVMKNGRTKVEYFGDKGSGTFKKKIIFDKEGNLLKQLKGSLVTETTAGIPTGFTRTVEVTGSDNKTAKRVTELYADMLPKKTITDGNSIIYGYSLSKPNKVVGHAYTQNDKYIIEFNNNPKFQKEFDNLESLYTWANGNFKKR